jgi:integrase/recombinase XerD
MDCIKWADKYTIDCRLKYNSLATQNNYISQVKSFLYHFEKAYREPKEIPTEEIKKWLLEKESPNTRNHRLCSIKSFYELTVKMPVKIDKIPFAKKEEKLPIPLSEIETKALFNACTNLKHKAILSLLFGCGLRVGDVINLRPHNIDRANDVIHIIGGKGGKDRIVPLGEKILALMEEYYKLYRPKSGYMFDGQFGGQYSQRSINLFIKEIGRKAGIKKHLHSHLGRHSYASQLYSSGTDLAKIGTILGHKSEKTTRIYAKTTSYIISKINSPINSYI